MLHLRVISVVQSSMLQEGINSRVSNSPSKGLKHMPFHLSEHIVIVEGAAHGLQFLDGRHAVLLVIVLGRNEQRCTSNQLIMALVDHTLRAVSVQKVDRQEQGGGQKLERSVGLDQEVKKVRSHKPLDFGLDVNGFDVGQGLDL